MDKYALKLTKDLEKLPPRSRLLFAFWVAKRLFHNYVFFSKATSFGDIDIMLDAFNLIDKYLKDEIKNEDEIIKAFGDIDENTPDTNDFSTVLVSFALDSCNALTECLRYILDENISHVVDIGIFARDTVDIFIQEINDMEINDLDFELNIQNNELMRKEITSQKIFLKRLKEKKVTLKEIVFDKIIDPSLV